MLIAGGGLSERELIRVTKSHNEINVGVTPFADDDKMRAVAEEVAVLLERALALKRTDDFETGAVVVRILHGHCRAHDRRSRSEMAGRGAQNSGMGIASGHLDVKASAPRSVDVGERGGSLCA